MPSFVSSMEYNEARAMLNDKLCGRCDQLTKLSWDPTRYERGENLEEKVEYIPVEAGEQQRECFIVPHGVSSRTVLIPVATGRPDPPDTKQWIHKTVAAIRASADRGECHLCYLILGQMKGIQCRDEARTKAVPTFERDRECAWSLKFLLLSEACFETTVSLNLSARVHGHINDSQTLHRRRLSNKTLARIKDWLVDCTRNHSECTPLLSLAKNKLPTRLLKLKSNPEGIHLKLVETKGLVDHGGRIQYAALSHCWEDGLDVKLLDSNYFSFLSDIPFENLPCTFREACIATSTLGLDFLWVDALCIIQEGDDWYSEAPLMRSVYSGSLVTLAATGSPNSHLGLFLQEYLDSSCPVNLRLKGADVPHGAWNISLDDATSFRRNVHSGPLNRRAWVFQELILSPRVLHFTKDQIWWECSKGAQCETKERVFTKSTVRAPGVWEGLVRPYAAMKLSVPQDRLIAIAGVAEGFALKYGFTPDDYVAGLWRPRLESQLMWRMRLSRPAPTNMTLYTAPSWSWASCTEGGNIEFLGQAADPAAYRWHPHFKVIRAITVTRGASKFGTLTGGSLRVQGALLDVRQRHALDLKAKLEPEILQKIFRYWKSDLVAGALFLLPMASHEVTVREKARRKFYFLVLERVEGQRGQFVRLNCEDAVAKDHGLPSWWLMGSGLEEEVYIKRHGDGIYEFEII